MKNHLAVDAGTCYVKVIEGGERNGRLFIKKVGFFPNPFPGFRESLVEREQDAFAKALREFLRSHRVREKSVVSSMGYTGVIVHYFDIPNIPQTEINPAIQLELMQVTPGGTKNLEYDYILLPGRNGRRTVLFVGYQRERCEFFTGALNRAGLKPLIMEHNSLAVLNCFNFLNEKHKGPVFILNMGHRTTNFALAEEKNAFILIRDIHFGGKNITELVAAGMNISDTDAEIYRSRKENAEDVKKLVESGIEELLFEVKTGMEYYRSRTEKSPATLFLTGGASVIPGVSEALERSLNIKVVLWNPLEQAASTKMFSFPEDLKKKGMIFAASLGLVLREIK